MALEDIRLRLRALAGLPADPDPAVVHNLLLELSGRVDSLAANATAFMSSLQRAIEVRRDGIDAVHVTAWEWDGKAHQRIERTFAGSAPVPAWLVRA